MSTTPRWSLQVRSLLGLVLCATFVCDAAAQTPNFGAPDASLPAAAGTGLSGYLWSSPDIAPVDDLAAANAYILAHSPDALFTATSVDYPNGPTGSTSTSDTIAAGLGVDAPSLTSAAVGANAALNSIFRFNGFLRVNAAGTLNLGVGSDDGSELRIQGTQVLNNDGLHSFPGAGPVAVDFTAPGLYAIEIRFFESQESGWGVEFYTDAAGAGTPVPTALLYPAPEPSAMALAGVVIALPWGRRVADRR
jgi:PA14 domain